MNEPIASESLHWYTREGLPCYEVPRAKGNGTRPATIADARKLDLVPSVTLILKCAAAPALENWKLRKLLEASLTLPRIAGETEDAFAERVITDSQEQGKKAAERGTALHAAIERWIPSKDYDRTWEPHIKSLSNTCLQYGIDLHAGAPEHSFASPLGYGGKIDFHSRPVEIIENGVAVVQTDGIVIDFKTKDVIDDSKQLAWDNHCQQLAAYGFGLGFKKFRALNVFIGCDDKQVRIHEHPWEDLERGFVAFRCLLGYWQITKRFGPCAKT
jgi:hypothetical protein